MASENLYLSTWYAKRILGDNAASSYNDALLQTGANIAADTWIFNQTNHSTSAAVLYGLKYTYDSSSGNDALEFYGGRTESSVAIPSIKAELSSGSIWSGSIYPYESDTYDLGSDLLGWRKLYLRGSPSNSHAIDGTYPFIEFSNSDRTQYARLIYTHYNDQGGAQSLAFIGNSGNTDTYIKAQNFMTNAATKIGPLDTNTGVAIMANGTIHLTMADNSNEGGRIIFHYNGDDTDNIGTGYIKGMNNDTISIYSNLAVNTDTKAQSFSGQSGKNNFALAVNGTLWANSTIYSNAGIHIYRNEAGSGGFKIYEGYGTNSLSQYANLYIHTLGVADTIGYTQLELGNNIASTADHNARGRIYLYGTNTYASVLYADTTNFTANREFHFPNYNGVQYAIHTGSTAAVGGQYAPVYIAANGRATEITSGTNAQFYRGDKTWSNTLNGAFTANGTITANGGYLKSTLNSNTIQIGSQNASYAHITNSADIPFWFNKSIWMEKGKTIGAAGTAYRPFQLYLGRNTTEASNALNSNNPLIEFSNSDRSQYCQLIYDDHDSLAEPDSLTLVGNQDNIKFILKNGPMWIQGGSNAGGNVNRLNTTSGMPGNMQHNVSRRGTQIYANGIAFADPYNGNSNSDAGWIRQIETTGNSGYLEIAVGDDGSEEIIVRQYKTDNTVGRQMYLLNSAGFTSVSNQSTNSSYAHAAMQIRETNYAGASTDSWGVAPRLAWHWSGRVAAQIGLASNGYLYTAPSTGTTFYKLMYESGTWGINITGYAAKLGTATVGAANRGIYLNAGTATALSWYPTSCTINGGNKANYPWHRFATCTTGTGQWTDKTVIVIIHSRYDSGPYGMVKLSLRTNATNAAKSTSAVWIYRKGFAVDDIKISTPAKTTGTDETINAYIKCGTYPRRIAYILEGSNLGWSLVSSNEPNDTTTSDKKGGTEINASVSGANASDGATVSYANSAGSSGSCTGNAATATRINGNLAAITDANGHNIWVSSGSGGDGIPKIVSGVYVAPSTKSVVAQNFFATGGSIVYTYNNTNWTVIPNYTNGNTGINACGEGVYIGYSNTKGIYFWTNGAQRASVNNTGLTGAVWNDFAEFRQSNYKEPGRVVIDDGKGTLNLCNERLVSGARIISDTYGISVGHSLTQDTPIGIGGRVLAYPYQDKSNYKVGDAVCSAPNGTIDIMTREEIIQYPERILGIVSEVPNYEVWTQQATKDSEAVHVKVKGRIWIYVK